jgi:hypothetical protein
MYPPHLPLVVLLTSKNWLTKAWTLTMMVMVALLLSLMLLLVNVDLWVWKESKWKRGKKGGVIAPCDKSKGSFLNGLFFSFLSHNKLKGLCPIWVQLP